MKRIWIAALLLVILCSITITGIYCIQKYSKELNTILEDAKQAADDGDYKAAAELCNNAEDKWVKSEKILILFVNHSDITEIGLTVARLEPLIKNDDLASFYTELRILQVQLIHIMNMESISVY